MALTFNQIMEAIGYAHYLQNYIKTMVEAANDPNTAPSDALTYKTNAMTSLDKIQILINTIYQALGRTQPNTTYTTQQLQALGIS